MPNLPISPRPVNPTSAGLLRRLARTLFGVDAAAAAQLVDRAAELDATAAESSAVNSASAQTQRADAAAVNSGATAAALRILKNAEKSGGWLARAREQLPENFAARSIAAAQSADVAGQQRQLDTAAQIVTALAGVEGATDAAAALAAAVERGRPPKGWHRKRGRGAPAPEGSTPDDRRAAVERRDVERARQLAPPAPMHAAIDGLPPDAARTPRDAGQSESAHRARRRRADAQVSPTHRGARQLARKAATYPTRFLRTLPAAWAAACDSAARGAMRAEEGRAARPRTSRTYRRVVGCAALLLSLSERSAKAGCARVVHGFSREAIVSMLPANEDTGHTLHVNTLSAYVTAFVAAGWVERMQPDGATSGSVERGPSGHAFNQYRFRPPPAREHSASALAKLIARDAPSESGGVFAHRADGEPEGSGPTSRPVTTDVDPASPRGKQITSAGPEPSG